MESIEEVKTYHIYKDKEDTRIHVDVKKDKNHFKNSILIKKYVGQITYFYMVESKDELEALIKALNEFKEELWPLKLK